MTPMQCQIRDGGKLEEGERSRQFLGPQGIFRKES